VTSVGSAAERDATWRAACACAYALYSSNLSVRKRWSMEPGFSGAKPSQIGQCVLTPHVTHFSLLHLLCDLLPAANAAACLEDGFGVCNCDVSHTVTSIRCSIPVFQWEQIGFCTVWHCYSYASCAPILLCFLIPPTAEMLRTIEKTYPCLTDSRMLSNLACQLAGPDLVAPFSAWPSPHVCLAYTHNMIPTL
jgi:hypothetical protein